MRLTYALEFPDSRVVKRLTRQFRSHRRLICALITRKPKSRSLLSVYVLEQLWVVRRLIALKCNVNVEINGNPIFWASNNGYTSSVNFILQCGASFNQTDKNQWTPLHTAALHKHADVAFTLLAAGANVNVIDFYGRTPLYNACNSGSVKTVSVLLQVNININKSYNYAYDAKGETVLHLTSKKGYVNIVSLLLAVGASVNVKDHTGMTPLHLAAYEGHAIICQLLIDSGADTQLVDKNNWPPLHYALRNGHTDAANVLRAIN